MNRKVKVGTLGAISVLSAAIIGLGTAILLKESNEENNLNLVSTNAKSTKTNFYKIEAPKADGINLEGLKKLEDKINMNIKGYVKLNSNNRYEPVKDIKLVNNFKGQKVIESRLVQDFVGEFFKGSKN